MRQEITKMLNSSEQILQMRGLTELHADCAEKQFVPSQEDFSFLREFLYDRANEAVRCHAMILLMTGILPLLFRNGLPAAPSCPNSMAGRGCLCDWLWGPFQETSVVFGTAGEYLRDGKALMELAARIPQTAGTKPEFVLVPLNSNEWEMAFNRQQCQAVCFVGRLGLYGAEAIRQLTNRNAVYDFPSHKKPPTCPPHGLDRKFHCIDGKRDDGRKDHYRTKDKNEVRTDYAIVQRFVVAHLGGQMIVVYIAGSTSLGTLGGVLWATSQRKELGAPDGMPLSCPENIRRDSAFEALLQVSARKDDFVWKPTDVKLLKLTAAGATWSAATGKWHPGITIECESGNPRESIAVFFGEEKEPMDANGQAFRLLVGIGMLSREDPERRVDLDKLAKDPWIWSGKELTKEKLRNKLASLKNRHPKLQNVLSNGPDLHLYADVRFRSLEPVAVLSELPAHKRRIKGGGGSAGKPNKPR
jgi:hypothetical protein